MRIMLRRSLVPLTLLLAVPPFAVAESPLPDPVPPAVIGRPLDQIRPARSSTQKNAAKPAAKQGAKPVAKANAKPAAKPVAKAAVPSAVAREATAPATGPRTRQALDDRADPRVRAAEVGKGTRLARKALAPGAYIGDRHRSAVRKYYEEHPVAAAGGQWRIGEPVPRSATLAPVPPALLARLPELPPGHRYVELGGEVLLIAAGSRMVVDAVERAAR